jgi:hypothetical protein
MSATKKEWATNLVNEFKFMSDADALYSSWVNGSGKYSAGYYEEICVIYDDLLFESNFLKEAPKFGFSQPLLECLDHTNKALNNFDGSGLDCKELLKNSNWVKCMELMEKAAHMLESELDKVPEIPINGVKET